MKIESIFFMYFFIFIIITSCDKEEGIVRNYPRLKTLEVTNISKEGATFNAEIFDRGDFEILQYGFVWSEDQYPTLESADKIINVDKLISDFFSENITTSFKGQKLYHIRAFLITEDFTVYGTGVEFISLGSKAPSIQSFFPLEGSWGDSIYLRGENFSFVKEKNIVKLSELTANVVAASDTSILFVIPAIKNTDSVRISLTLSGNTAFSSKFFKYLIPEISLIDPLYGTFRDTITIIGNNFGKSLEYNFVRIKCLNSLELDAEILESSKNKIKFKVPDLIDTRSSIINLSAVGFESNYSLPFILDPPIIDSYGPDSVFIPNEKITIMGSNFCPLPENNIVLFGDHSADVIESGHDRIKVVLPNSVIPNYYTSVFEDLDLSVIVAEQNFTTEDKLHISWYSTWTRKKDFPGIARKNAVSFSIGGKGYCGTGYTEENGYLNDFWEYDPMSDEWNRIQDLPGEARAYSTAFTLNDEGYVGLGKNEQSSQENKNFFKDFYKYNPESKNWARIVDFQGVGRYGAASFVLVDEAYVGTGWWGLDLPYGNFTIADDIWKYDPIQNLWIDFNRIGETYFPSGFNIENNGYIFSYSYLYLLEGLDWRMITSLPIGAWENVAFSLNGMGYIGLGSNHGRPTFLWEYNPITNEFRELPWSQFGKRNGGASVIVIENKAYIIGFSESGINDVWIFDPSKP